MNLTRDETNSVTGCFMLNLKRFFMINKCLYHFLRLLSIFRTNLPLREFFYRDFESILNFFVIKEVEKNSWINRFFFTR